MDNLFKITGVIETMRIDPQGEVVKIHKVSATTKSGDRFTLEIPDQEFTVEKVQDLVRVRAQELEDLRQL